MITLVLSGAAGGLYYRHQSSLPKNPNNNTSNNDNNSPTNNWRTDDKDTLYVIHSFIIHYSFHFSL